MSKNFELLQQLGSEEELFQTGGPSTETAPAKSGGPNMELDREAREKILQNASLPDVFQGTTKDPDPVLAKPSELNFDLNEERDPRILQDPPPSEEFRTSRNPSRPIGELSRRPEKRAASSNGNNRLHSRALSTDKKLKTSHGGTSPEPLPETKKEPAPRIFPETSSPRPWAGAIRTAANRCGWRPQGNKSHHEHDGVDVDGIAREEGIKLVQRVFPETDEDSPRITVFAGLEGESGCGSICARAGELLAARGEGPVCIVDANFRLPSLHRYFGVENEKGLAEATLEAGPIQNFAQQIPEPDLWLMPSGKAAANLSFPAMADGLRVRIAELRDTYRYVVIHSGPLRLETSAMLLSRWTDGVVLVLEANATRRDTARRTKENLATAGVSVLGVVLNNRTFPIPEAIYRRL